MERTLILLKPDCLQKNHVGEVISRFETEGFKIIGIKMIQMTHELLTEHYAHIADKPFFPEVVNFMSSTPVIAMVLTGDNVIERVRDILGPTDSTEAAPETLRGQFGVDKMVNVAHASDSSESAAVEVRRFFSSGEICDYLTDRKAVA